MAKFPIKSKTCTLCEIRPRKFHYRGRLSTDKEHDLCLQCYRNLSESQKQTRVRFEPAWQS